MPLPFHRLGKEAKGFPDLTLFLGSDVVFLRQLGLALLRRLAGCFPFWWLPGRSVLVQSFPATSSAMRRRTILLPLSDDLVVHTGFFWLPRWLRPEGDLIPTSAATRRHTGMCERNPFAEVYYQRPEHIPPL